MRYCRRSSNNNNSNDSNNNHNSQIHMDEMSSSSSLEPNCSSNMHIKPSPKKHLRRNKRKSYAVLTTTAMTISIATSIFNPATSTFTSSSSNIGGGIGLGLVSAFAFTPQQHPQQYRHQQHYQHLQIPSSSFNNFNTMSSFHPIRLHHKPSSTTAFVSPTSSQSIDSIIPPSSLSPQQHQQQQHQQTSSPSLPSSSTKNRINFYDLEELVAPKPTYTINPEAAEGSTSSSIMKRNIVHLLSDDDGEEDECIPDYSEEAANEIADKMTYSRISEEAKAKANYAVQKIQKNNEKNDGRGRKKSNLPTSRSTSSSPSLSSSTSSSSTQQDEHLFDHHMEEQEYQQTQQLKKKRKFTASVKETGVDTMSQYVKSMGSHELLPKESEILLGKQIQILVQWENVRQELEEKLSSPPTFAQWSKKLGITVPELKKQIRRSQRAKAALIEANLRLVVTVARQTVKKGRSEINFQDACQEGIIGLSKACEKFDPEKGFRFSTYAIWWIKREVRKNLLEQSRSVRLPASAIKKINDIRINERLLMTTLGRKPTDEEVAQKCNLTVEKVLFYRRKALDATSLDKQLVGKDRP